MSSVTSTALPCRRSGPRWRSRRREASELTCWASGALEHLVGRARAAWARRRRQGCQTRRPRRRPGRPRRPRPPGPGNRRSGGGPDLRRVEQAGRRQRTDRGDVGEHRRRAGQRAASVVASSASSAAASRRLATSARQSGTRPGAARSWLARCRRARRRRRPRTERGCHSCRSLALPPSCRGAGSVRLGSGSWRCRPGGRASSPPPCACSRRSRRAPAPRAGRRSRPSACGPGAPPSRPAPPRRSSRARRLVARGGTSCRGGWPPRRTGPGRPPCGARS